MTLRVGFTIYLDNRNFAGFYRKNPLSANITFVAYECWNSAVMSGFALIRVTKLFIVILLYVGRVDRPILADGVGDIGPLSMDYWPEIFKQDLLSVEAHRHPYIERLGMMYMMKLKNGKKFACRAGSRWRLLFVCALMPYLRKERISVLQNADADDDSNGSDDNKSEKDGSVVFPLQAPQAVNDASQEIILSKDCSEDEAEAKSDKLGSGEDCVK